VISIIATAICECFKERPEQEIGPEEAKQIAKCVIEALAEAGLEMHLSFAVDTRTALHKKIPHNLATVR
jgi:hypothetical protein